jgi:hypothetical protein
MNSVGIDLHKRRSHIAALSDDGRKLLSRRIDNDPAAFLELLAEVGQRQRVDRIASARVKTDSADVLEEAGYELHLAHPLRTKAKPLPAIGRLGARSWTRRRPAAHGPAAGGLDRP